MGMRGGNSGGSSSIESKWEAAMEAELGEKDADGRSERPPYAPCDKRSLLSLGPSSRSWLGRLSEWFRQGNSRLSVLSFVRKEVPGARGRVMGRGLIAGQGPGLRHSWMSDTQAFT